MTIQKIIRTFSFLFFTLSLFPSSASGDFDDGYEWAEESEIDNFDDCQYEFGTGEDEDGCNEYVKENKYSGSLYFKGYECTEDCSGHEAGYTWAEDNEISDEDDCISHSESFTEGCQAYVQD